MRKAEQLKLLREQTKRRGKTCAHCGKFQPLYEFRPIDGNSLNGLEDVCDFCWDEAHGRKRTRTEPDVGSRAGVYFIQAGKAGPIKIGYADHPNRRVIHLQIGNAAELRLLLVLPGDQRLERLLHEQFSKHRIRGEWFKPDRKIRTYIKQRKAEQA